MSKDGVAFKIKKKGKNMNKDYSAVLEIIVTKALFFLSSLLFFALTFWAIKYKHTYYLDLMSEHVWSYLDSTKINLFFLVVFLVILYGIQFAVLRGNPEKQRKKVRIFLYTDLILVGIFAVVWVSGCHIMPRDDQYQVYLTAIEFSKGNFEGMQTYFYMCPQQYGLAFLLEGILWIWESYHFVQYINIIFLLMILYFGCQISDCLFENPRINLYTILAMNAFLPMFFYVNFVYGEMCAVATGICAIWAVLMWVKSNKTRYAVIAVVAMIFAFLVRMNMIIISIALIIALLVIAFGKRDWKALIVSVALVLIPVFATNLVELSYELRSGYEVGEGIPIVANVAMGMQESWNGAGAFNGYNQHIFWENNGVSKDSAIVAKEYIKARIAEFVADPAKARYFYQCKIWEQWNVGCFGSLIMTNHFESVPFEPAREVYNGTIKIKLFEWMEYYLFVMYFSAFLYSVHGLFREKDIKKTILPTIVLGGVIFSLLWEAKARYVFPYVTIMLPTVAFGLNMCHVATEHSISYLFRHFKRRRNIAQEDEQEFQDEKKAV